MTNKPDTMSRTVGAGKPETLKLTIGKARLVAEKVAGTWRFFCQRWPDLPVRFNGAADANECLSEFTRRALQGAREAKKGRA